ncbi:hematopoietic SH2 domain-containing protein [Petaurus breviceps papuanus]|uniref:hematopoietic SH2 domain-containing protein n=1 Tax=Petaurus breviceps papuanus TaxID=3040969 RepID=UPI0036DB19E7
MQAPSLSSHPDWCGETEASWQRQHEIPTWYHGSISRQAAENLLQKKLLGCFLVRESLNHVGYTLSYRAQDCCRHFMITLLANGCLMIPGEERVHSTLVDLVNYHQENPLKPYKELLTQPCSQVSLRPQRMTKTKSGRPNSSSQPWVKPLEQSPAPGHSQESGKALLNDAPQKIWKNLKNLPQTGKKITEQIKGHLSDVKLFPSSAVPGNHVESQIRGGPSLVGDESAIQGEDSHPEKESQNPPSNIYTDPFEQAPLAKHASHPKSQDLCLPSRKMVETSTTPISTSEEAIFPGPRRGVILGTTCQDSPRPEGAKLGSFPEEYYPPPPFAPGY